MKLEQINWCWDNNELQSCRNFYEHIRDDDGIRLYVNRHDKHDLKAIHPDVDINVAFNVEKEIDATVSFHSNSYTIVEVTRDSFRVMFSERASPHTIEDVTILINKCSRQWSEQRTEAFLQHYTIEWNSHQQDYVIHTIQYERDWS